MMKIEKQIFMGNGDHTYAVMGYLHSRLEDAFKNLGSIQQARGEDTIDEEREVKRIAKEIYLALTGEKAK